MSATFFDKLVFPAPKPTYGKDTFKKYLCWIPWNEAVSPEKVDNEWYAEGIPCLWLPSPKAAGVLLFCHGNAEDLGMCFQFLKRMRDQFRMNILAVEYPGYGLLHKMPASEAAVKEAVLTAFRFVLDELRVNYEQVILFGRSVGSGPSVYLASRFPVGGLILVAAFISIREAAKSLVGDLVGRVLAERFPNLPLIGNVSCPTLFIHGMKDTLVPMSHSVRLFKQCRARKLLITPPGMEHNTNLFTDASFLAVPAINFFGLPGYQQDSPPQMPKRCYQDGALSFRSGAMRKPPRKQLPVSSWSLFCGCPNTKGPTIAEYLASPLQSREYGPDSTHSDYFGGIGGDEDADNKPSAANAVDKLCPRECDGNRRLDGIELSRTVTPEQSSADAGSR